MKHEIEMPEIKQEKVDSVDLVFENGDVITVYKPEILVLDLTLDKELEWTGGKLVRRVKSGKIVLNLMERFNHKRPALVGMNRSRRRPTLTELKHRIIGVCDITMLVLESDDFYAFDEEVYVPYDTKEDMDWNEKVIFSSTAKYIESGYVEILMGEKSELDKK